MRASLVLILVLAATGFSIAAERPAPSRPVSGDAQDLVLFLGSRPFLIRLHLQVKGRSFRENWDESIAFLFRYLDVDGDSVLSKKEAALAPSKTQWVQLMTGAVVEPDAAPEFAELAGSATATKATLEHFSLYYRKSGAGALQIEWGWRPSGQDRLGNTLFQQFDKDKDGNLSREELLAAKQTLQALDVNGDDLIEAAELPGGGVNPAFNFRSTTDDHQSVPANFPFVIVQTDTPAATLAAAILKRYDRDRDGKCTSDECQIEKASFDRLDKNHDGRLDAAELAEWRKLPPDLEFLVSLEPSARKDILLLPAEDGKPNRLSALLSPNRDGAVRIPLAEKQLEVSRYTRQAKARQELLKQFDKLAGKNDVLAEKQIYQPPFTFVALLRLADRNSDNRLSHKELAEYLDVQEKFLFRTSYLTVVDRGASLFEFLDADHDGRLSPRELRSVWNRLSVWDRDHINRIARRQVPRQFQLVFSYGQSRAGYFPNFQYGFSDLPLVRDKSRGPLWFRKMDRNGDGDVSRGEFLGTIEQFRRIDTDGDGLIDLSEAERADATLRKKP